MVGEFPELQGIAGRYYAAAAGESAEVADAIDEAYMPRFAGDAIAPSKLGAGAGRSPNAWTRWPAASPRA